MKTRIPLNWVDWVAIAAGIVLIILTSAGIALSWDIPSWFGVRGAGQVSEEDIRAILSVNLSAIAPSHATTLGILAGFAATLLVIYLVRSKENLQQKENSVSLQESIILGFSTAFVACFFTAVLYSVSAGLFPEDITSSHSNCTRSLYLFNIATLLYVVAIVVLFAAMHLTVVTRGYLLVSRLTFILWLIVIALGIWWLYLDFRDVALITDFALGGMGKSVALDNLNRAFLATVLIVALFPFPRLLTSKFDRSKVQPYSRGLLHSAMLLTLAISGGWGAYYGLRMRILSQALTASTAEIWVTFLGLGALLLVLLISVRELSIQAMV